MLLLAVIIARMVVFDPVRKSIMGMSDVVFMIVAVVVIPCDFVLVACHWTAEMLERVRVTFRVCIDQKQDRKHQYE